MDLNTTLLCAEATFNLTKEDSGFVKDGLVLSNLAHDQISYFEARRSIKFLSYSIKVPKLILVVFTFNRPSTSSNEKCVFIARGGGYSLIWAI